MTFYACRWRFPILRRRAFLAQKILMIISGYFTVFGYIFGHKLHLFYRHFAHKDQYQFLSKDNIDRRKRVTLFYSIFTRRVQFRERAETARSAKVTLLWFISSSVTHVTTFWVLAASEMSNDCDNVKISTKANTKDFAFFDVTLIVRKIACNKGRTEGSVFGPSVTRWRDCVFNILPFKAIKIALRS